MSGREIPPRVFVTIPRFFSGIPITLGTVTNISSSGGPLIRGYPNYTWNANQGSNCNGLTSVFRVAVRIFKYALEQQLQHLLFN